MYDDDDWDIGECDMEGVEYMEGEEAAAEEVEEEEEEEEEVAPTPFFPMP